MSGGIESEWKHFSSPLSIEKKNASVLVWIRFNRPSGNEVLKVSKASYGDLAYILILYAKFWVQNQNTKKPNFPIFWLNFMHLSRKKY